ncbi:iron ABC transporter permease [Formosimonas limnophila]|uniref:Iron ABC transporter permease n=1 Tax=Formosimonas limnophila TaxID=1384487 RepID=A0A8J3FYU9_9BURK|nr:iron ABC transporter permease [Formosimonas limnophila]GHA76292.1 iron ABC transporter permease [Formosimonas limnophila]
MNKSTSHYVRNIGLVMLLSMLILPWYMPSNTNAWKGLWSLWYAPDFATALAHMATLNNPWLVPFMVLAAVVIGVGFMPRGVLRGRIALVFGILGSLSFIYSGFAIGLTGASLGLEHLPGASQWRQFGMGLGAYVYLWSMFALIGVAIAELGYFKGDALVATLVVCIAAMLLIFVGWPVGKSILNMFYVDEAGVRHLSSATWMARMTERDVWSLACVYSSDSCGVFWNTLFLATICGITTTVLGLIFALLGERRGFFGQYNPPWLRAMALLPVITPPFVLGLGLLLLFGRQGILTQLIEGTFGVTLGRWIYGLDGVVLAQTFAFTPVAYMIIRGAVQALAPSLEEAAQTLGSDNRRTFWTVTFPLLLPALGNSFLIGFVESIADFGNPILLGENYKVFSTEIYFAIVGATLDPGRAAGLSFILLLLAMLAFYIQHSVVGKKNYVTVGGKGDSGIPMALPKGVKRAGLAIALPWLALTIALYAFALIGGLVQNWGLDYTPSLVHFKKAFGIESGVAGIIWSGTAWSSLWTTMKLALIAAPITALIGILTSYVLARTEFKGRDSFEFANLITFAIPGTVLGVSYIMAFNLPPFELTGTAAIIVLSFIFRNLPVSVRAGLASFKQIDKSLDEASLMLGSTTLGTLRRVTFPLLRPAIITSLSYGFVRAVTTITAVIFLVNAEYHLATTFIIERVGNGAYGEALAYCSVLIVLMLVVLLGVQKFVGDAKLGRRSNGQ